MLNPVVVWLDFDIHLKRMPLKEVRLQPQSVAARQRVLS